VEEQTHRMTGHSRGELIYLPIDCDPGSVLVWRVQGLSLVVVHQIQPAVCGGVGEIIEFQTLSWENFLLNFDANGAENASAIWLAYNPISL
jgi:hypothetical protein